MNYVTTVADLFLKLNPEITILEPADYLTIAEWEKQEIPLEVVFASIGKACFQLRRDNHKLEGLDNIREIIKHDFEMWLQKTQSCQYSS